MKVLGRLGGDPGLTGQNGAAAAPTIDYSEPFQRAIELIGKRWTGAVIRALLASPARFNRLLMGIPGISDRVLTERLRELEDEGLVDRLVDPGPPVRVTYRLTPRGRTLAPVVEAVDAWAREGE
jgi:DNA-binding HxlR family transcriptional regulator